ncbi:MAG: cadmium-translocating P-type ATPase [Lachnospiraceae bacterium]|nr:cadmium-translocating P-type ATPase [Lachnospiraceae bacterium]
MNRKQKIMLYRILAAAALLVVLLALQLEGLWQLLYLIPYFIVGYDILRKAVWGITHGEVFDENFLMAVATVGAVLLGDFLEGVAVMLFYQVGELFQSYAVGKSRKSISDLMDISPDYANVETEDGLEQVDPDDVEIGTVIVILPGEKVPIDGVVEEGVSTLNTSALTGESLPRDVAVGDEIISGCINMTGLLKVRTTKEFGESTVSKVLELVENSAMKKSKAENFITRFAKYYTPIVCYAALALAVLPPLFNVLILGQPAGWGDWITRGLTFLVISCPCALVISIPLSFFGGIGGASARGILVKGSIYLEALAESAHVVFDKTGTLTRGVFEVKAVHPAGGMEADELLTLAALAECYSTHPISKSLREACPEELDLSRIEGFDEVAGHGVRAIVDGKRVAAGNDKLMKKIGITHDPCEVTGTIVHVAVDGAYAGHIVIGDVVKPTAKQAIAGLKSAGVKRTVMLTGDSEQVAAAVAKDLAVDEYHSELLPGDKVDWVEKLLEQKTGREKLAFVGDGINDAPVLSRADIGIAMGAMGSDAAIEAADVVLMDDDPAKIALAMKISRKCLGIVHQNIWFALTVKALCLILGAIGKADMWLAIFADVGVMVIAVVNAMRALDTKKL